MSSRYSRRALLNCGKKMWQIEFPRRYSASSIITYHIFSNCMRFFLYLTRCPANVERECEAISSTLAEGFVFFDKNYPARAQTYSCLSNFLSTLSQNLGLFFGDGFLLWICCISTFIFDLQIVWTLSIQKHRYRWHIWISFFHVFSCSVLHWCELTLINLAHRAHALCRGHDAERNTHTSRTVTQLVSNAVQETAQK